MIVAELVMEPRSPEQYAQIMSRLATAHRRWYREEPELVGDHQAQLVGLVLHLALAALTYAEGYLHQCGLRKTRQGTFHVWLEFHQPQVSHSALALIAAQCAIADSGSQQVEVMSSQMHQLWRICQAHHPCAEAESLMEAARVGDVPYLPAWGITRHWQFGWGVNSEVMLSSGSNRDGCVSSQIINDKRFSKVLLRTLGWPTPDEVLLDNEDETSAALDRIGFPCVVKPVDEGHGNGVSVGLENADQVRVAFRLARTFSTRQIILERFAPGSDHRLLVAEGKLVGVFRKDPPAIVGDGCRSVSELIDELNRDRSLPGVITLDRLVGVTLDDAALQHLDKQGCASDTILPAGRKITLRGNSNIGTGGTSTEVTSTIHPDIRVAAEALARTLKANFIGIDYLTTDITRSWREVPGTFLELNLTPGAIIPVHAGWSRARAGEIALGKTPDRIPVDCIVVPDAARIDIEERLAQTLSDVSVGWASHDKAQVGAIALTINYTHPWAGVLAILSNAMVRQVIVVVFSQQLQRFGLPVDRASRIWLCDGALPAAWADVLVNSSDEPIWRGNWDDCLNRLLVPYNYV